jgi:hypothetical protein
VVILEKQYFEASFAKAILKSNTEQKLFLWERLSMISSNLKIEDYVKKIKPIVYYI